MTADTLKALNVKDLEDLARKRGVRGWHGMRKDQLVKALVRTSSSNKPSQGSAAVRTVKAVSKLSQPKSGRLAASRRSASPGGSKAVAKAAAKRNASVSTALLKVTGLRKVTGKSAVVSKSMSATKGHAAKQAPINKLVAVKSSLASKTTVKPSASPAKQIASTAKSSAAIQKQTAAVKNHAVASKNVAKHKVVLKTSALKTSAAKNETAKPVVAATKTAPATKGHGVANSNGTSNGKLAATNGKPAAKSAAAVKMETVRALATKIVAVEKPRDSAVAKRLQQIRSKTDRLKNLSSNTPQDRPGGIKDRLVVMVRDSYWLHAFWELSRHSIERAEAALGQEWHCAKPILRVYEVSEGGTTSAAETALRDIDIHGGVSNWYIDVVHPPRSYRVDIGYLGSSGKLFVLARSNIVNTPRPGVKDALDENWSDVAQNYDKIFAMSGGYEQEGSAGALQELFEERLRRPMGSPMVTRYGAGVEALMTRRRHFNFEIDAELIVYGRSEPDSHVTLQGEPVKLRPDGSFTMRFSMPNARQVIPAVASSANGLEQRTVVLAVERNTKIMEPLVRDSSE